MLANFLMVKASHKWRIFNEKESRTVEDYATRPKRKNITEGGARDMFPNVSFICKDYKLQVYQQTGYFKIADEKSKIAATKNDDNETIWAIYRC